MSESKVPLPDPYGLAIVGNQTLKIVRDSDLTDYGDARAAAARRLALLEAATHVYMVKLEATEESADDLGVSGWLAEAEHRLRALADGLDMSQPAKAQSPARPPAGQ